MERIKIYIIVILLIGCLEEINNPIDIKSNSSFDLATYLEVSGDFIHSSHNPALIEVDELYQNINNYLIIDVRSQTEYHEGHIQNSVNIESSEVISYLEDVDPNNFSKVVIVCENGHESAFITTLLRFLGYQNTYSLNYGLGYWNPIFSKVWFDNSTKSPYRGFYTNINYPKPNLKENLPNLNFEKDIVEINDRLQFRVKSLLENEFEDNITGMVDFENLYNYKDRNYDFVYIICYGDNFLYSGLQEILTHVSPPVTIGGHPRTAVHYNPRIENQFLLSTNLLTLPTEQPIIIYSYNGQRSAYILAFLKLLGYNVRIIEYGALSMLSFAFIDEEFVYDSKTGEIIDTLYKANGATPYGFWNENIREYPVVTGQ